MTIEQAINELNLLEMFAGTPKAAEAVRISTEALREKAERENPAPLTLEELAHMRGEPVWIVWPDCQIAARWWIVGGYDWAVMEFDDYTTMKTYGKTWVAYRHKPKEER